MAGLPDAMASKVLDFITARTTQNQTASTVYLALLTADPGANPAMTDLVEITDTGYARQLVSYSAPTLSPPGTVNGSQFTYGPFSPSGMLSGASYAALVDFPTGLSGIVRYVWMMDNPMQAAIGESVQFPAASLGLGW